MARPRTSHKHLPKYVTINNGSYYYGPPDVPKVRISRAEDGEHVMYGWLANHLKDQPSGPLQTLADSFDRYQREIVPTLAPRTQKDYARHLKTLRMWCGHLRPDELRPRDVGQFLDVQKGKIQRNRQVAVLSAIYAYMVGRWYVAERNPCLGVMRNPSKRRTRYVTNEEYAAVYAMMPPRMQVAMDLALLTGQRQGDLLGLTWKQVDAEAMRIYMQQGKTGKKLAIRITPRLEEVLVRAKRMVPQLPRLYVIRKADGTRYTAEGFRAIWQRHMKRAAKGYSLKAHRGATAVEHPPVIGSRFTFHDLRAKNISDTKDIQKAFERAGHTSMAMTRGTYDRNFRDVDPLE